MRMCLPDQYEHNGLCCDFCQEGNYVLNHCDNSTLTKCLPCSHDTYMNEKNGLPACLLCTQCDSNNHQRELKPCKAHSDRVCTCEDGYYCTHNDTQACTHCKQFTPCPPGKGVFAKSSSKEIVCRPCLPGTFNNVTDYQTPCYNHTSCEKLGRYLMNAGTLSADAVCGDFLKRCHWISAGMGGALVLTILICIGLLYWMIKHKQQKTVSSTVSPHHTVCDPHSDNLPALPPDIIHLQSNTHTVDFSDEVYIKQDDSMVKCDCITTTSMALTKINGFSVAREIASDNSLISSEPQEDEWPGSSPITASHFFIFS
ncbi:tumor necrosis factor receptor superfamily member 5 [Brachyhypopomus gauderio]|uniref:tumor necrosis factor receptor superfamily member 5 n=1 Tax=Brachyhypopomus gauderio TaxID=698409 RepID=UPI004041E68D